MGGFTHRVYRYEPSAVLVQLYFVQSYYYGVWQTGRSCYAEFVNLCLGTSFMYVYSHDIFQFTIWNSNV